MISVLDWFVVGGKHQPFVAADLLTSSALSFLAAIMLIARHGGVVGLALIAVGIAMRRRWGGWLALCFPLGVIVFGIWIGFAVIAWIQSEAPHPSNTQEIRRAG